MSRTVLAKFCLLSRDNEMKLNWDLCYVDLVAAILLFFSFIVDIMSRSHNDISRDQDSCPYLVLFQFVCKGYCHD